MSATKRKAVATTSAAAKISKTIIKQELDPESEPETDDIDFTNEPSQFSCEVCKTTFVTRMSLNRHMVYHEDMPKFPCTFCKKIFYLRENLSNHITNDHGGAKFACQYCDRNLSRRDHLIRHITNVHPEHLLEVMKNEIPDDVNIKAEVKVDVKIVKKESPSSSNRNKSPPTHQTPVINCKSEIGNIKTQEMNEDEYSDDSFEDEVDIGLNFNYGDVRKDQGTTGGNDSPEDYDEVTKIKASLNGIRVERKYQCQECGASYMSKINLQRHMTTHAIDRPHKCPMCGKGFVRKEHLTKHLSSVHSGMKFTCEFCGKDISRKDHLIRHIRNVHPTEYLGIPPEIVENQDIEFSLSDFQASGFTISERALKSMQPKPKKPYLSCDLCDDTFNHINELHEHQSVVHCDVRRFRCNYCPKAFKRKEHLTKHEVLHTGEKNFCCDNCGKEFPRKDALQDHIRRIHGVDNTSALEYPCNFCEKVFLQRPNLIRHMRTVHALVVDPDGEGNEIPIENSEEQGQRQGQGGSRQLGGNISLRNDIFVTQPQGTLSNSNVVNPILYNGNGNQSLVSFRDEVNFMQDNLQGFSCAHCKAVFNNEKLFLNHLKTHQLK